MKRNLVNLLMGALLLPLLIASLHSAMAQAVPNSPETLWMRGKHNGGIFAVAVSPDGNTLASIGADDTLRLWRMSDQSLLRTIYVPDNGNDPTAVAFSNDGQYIFTGGGTYDNLIRQWRLSDGSQVNLDWFPASEGHTNRINDLAVSPDGATLASASVDHTIILWNLATGHKLTPLSGANGHTSAVNQVAWSPDSMQLASAGADNRVKIWKLVKGTWTWQRNLLQKVAVNCVAWSGNGKYVASGSGYGEWAVKMWNPATGKNLQTLVLSSNPTFYALAFSSNSQYLATGDDRGAGSLYTVSVAGSLTYLHPAANCASAINTLVFNPANRNQIVIGSGDLSTIWDIRFGSNLGVFTGHQGGVKSVAIAPSGQMVASGSGYPEYAIRLWSISDGTPFGVIGNPTVGGTTTAWHTSDVNGVAFSPDNMLLASGSADQTVRFWNVTHPLQVVPKYPPFNTNSTVNCVAFSPDGTQLAAACGDGTIHRYNTQAGTEIKPVLTDKSSISGAIYCLAYSPDGSQIVSGSNDAKLRTWKTANGSITGRYTGHTYPIYAVAWSQDGAWVASGGSGYDDTVRLWNTSNWTNAILGTHTQPVASLSFSPDSKNLMSSSGDAVIQVWKVSDGALTFYTSDTCNGVYSVAFAPGSSTFAYGGANGVVGLAMNPYAVIPAQITSVATDSSTLIGGNWTVGTVSIQSAVADDVTVDLSTNPSDEVFTDSSVVIPAGATSATFYVGSLPLVSTTPVTLYATLDGVTQSVSLSVAPALLATLTLSPTSVKGGKTATGTVQLSGPAPEGGITVQLSTDSAVAAVPATVHFWAGYSSATFTIATSAVKANTTADISAKLNSTVMTTKLTVTP